MMKLLLTTALIILAPLTAIPEANGNFVVIVNKANPVDHLSPAKVKIIFLRNVSRWPWGAEIVPVDLPDQNVARRSFLRDVMSTTPDQLQVYWIEQKVSRSVSPPLRAPTARDAKAIVASQPGAVAYIPAKDADDSVRIVQVK